MLAVAGLGPAARRIGWLICWSPSRPQTFRVWKKSLRGAALLVALAAIRYHRYLRIAPRALSLALQSQRNTQRRQQQTHGRASSKRLRGTLVVGEIALTLVLLAGAILICELRQLEPRAARILIHTTC